MVYSIFADIVVVVHFTFILSTFLGGFFVVRWPRLAWLHVPIMLWAILIEFFGWTCPLTPLEHWLRLQSGSCMYATSFTEHYILPLIYPSGLTYQIQVILGTLVLVINALVYTWVIRRHLVRRESS